MVKWAKKDSTLLVFQEMLIRVFENSGRYIKLKAVHESFLTFVCQCPAWTISSLLQIAVSSVSILREESVLKLTIGKVTVFNDIHEPEFEKVIKGV